MKLDKNLNFTSIYRVEIFQFRHHATLPASMPHKRVMRLGSNVKPPLIELNRNFYKIPNPQLNKQIKFTFKVQPF